MTHDERAKALMDDMIPVFLAGMATNDLAVVAQARISIHSKITAAITAAVDVERGACAKVAENTCPSSNLEVQEMVQKYTAAAIRARSKP